jgi:hypothetical protein
MAAFNGFSGAAYPSAIQPGTADLLRFREPSPKGGEYFVWKDWLCLAGSWLRLLNL